MTAARTWQDPEKVSNDERAEEAVGDGIVTALALINNLEVNERVLYARMTNVEQSTLIE